MAASRPLPVLPDLKCHYKHVLYTFVDHFEAYLQELTCPICQEIVEEPLQTSCGHIFCEKCHRKSNNPLPFRKQIPRTPTSTSYAQCPICRQQHTTVKDNFNGRRVKSLQVRCRNHKDGCKWVGTLADEEGHREKENGCEFQPILCPHQGCNALVMRRDMNQHTNVECPLRPYHCEYCNMAGPYQSVTGPHYKMCKMYPVKCPNGCTIETIPRKEVRKHMQEHCPLQPIVCPHKGCNASGMRRDMNQHTNVECPLRPYHCEYCNMAGPYQSVTGPHYKICKMYPVKCPNGCTIETIPRKEVRKHMQEDCPLQLVPCRYKRIGCTEQVRRQNLKRHYEEKKDCHLQLAMEAVVELTSKVDKMAAKIEELTEKFEKNDTRLQAKYVPNFDDSVFDEFYN